MTTIIINAAAPIQTVTPTLSMGEIQLSADRRSTKEKPLTDAERVRRVVLPVGHWGVLEASVDGQKNQSLLDVLRNALVRIGSEYLKDKLEETPLLREVPLSELTVPALLKWSEETATSRGSITFTRDQAINWFEYKLWPLIAEKYEQQKRTAISGFLKNRYGALAAKNHGLSEVADALKLMTLIPEAIAGDSISIEIAGRLQHIEKQLTAKANEATVSMNDL